MDVRVLGGVQVVSDPPLALGGPTQRRLLAALALRRNEVVSVSYLVEVIWPDGTATGSGRAQRQDVCASAAHRARRRG